MTEAFVRNLKLLNAKERDHLMRFAYLGQNEAYSDASTFLSDAIDTPLRAHAVQLGLDPSAKCVFAGMDYHLDWLFAAIWLAKDSPDRAPQDQIRVPLEKHVGVDGIKALYTDFRPISGTQEDLDLLAVYDDGKKVAVLFIEAKGAAVFERVQLARKLIRLDRILVVSGMTAQENQSLAFRLILAAPKRKEPKFTCCLTYAIDLKPQKDGEDKFRFMRKALESHPSGIGTGLHFLPIDGFPKVVRAVERERAAKHDPKAEAFTHWTLRKR